MRPGIIIQHAREVTRDTALVRSDVAGFIGVVPKARWPANAVPGDFLEMQLTSWSDLLANPARHFFDPATRRAVRSFFENGGVTAKLFGVCIESEQDLMAEDPFGGVFASLFDRLRGEEDVGLLSIPVLAYLPVEIRAGKATVAAQPIMEMMLLHCHEMNNRFAVFDTPRDLHDEPLRRWVAEFREKMAPHASFGAIYYPWLMSGDELFPPSGSVAGVFARVDHEHAPFGVRWPPANETLRGVTHPAVPLRWAEAGDYNELGINPILSQPSRGVVIWGARTLSTDPRWLHINSRRIVSFVAEQLRRDAEWVVFEHQRPELWEIVRRMVTNRLDQLWGAGLLTGDRAGSDYLVRCDRELNPPEERDAGRINVLVHLRPITTAEHIVVELRLGAEGSVVGSV